MGRRRRPTATTRARRGRTVTIAPVVPSGSRVEITTGSLSSPTNPIEGVDPAVIQIAIDGIVRGEPKSITIAKMVGKGVSPLRAAEIYDHVNANKITGTDLILRDATGWVREILDVVLPVAKIAAGGLGLLVVGGALVYVAGRYSKPGKAVTGATGAAGKVVDTALPARRAAKLARGTARAESSRSLARARTDVRVGKTGRERVRTVSKAEGRRRLIAEGEATAATREASARQRTERGPEIGKGLPAPRRRLKSV